MDSLQNTPVTPASEPGSRFAGGMDSLQNTPVTPASEPGSRFAGGEAAGPRVKPGVTIKGLAR